MRWWSLRRALRSSLRFSFFSLRNALLRIRWLSVALILLVLHFLVGVPLWLFWLALGLWLVYVILLALFCVFANYCGNLPTVQKPNRNPYSADNADVFSFGTSGGALDESEKPEE